MSERQIGSAGGNLVLDLFVLQQRIGELMAAALEGTGVRPAEYAVYSQLGDGIATARDLTLALGLTPSTLTGHLAAIERRGHLQRAANPSDGRSHVLALTPAGDKARERCRRAFAAMLRRLDDELEIETGDVRRMLAQVDAAAMRAMT